MERPNYKLQALIYHCKSILELYDRSLCTQRFHMFANKRNVEHNLWWLSDWVAIRLTRYVVTRVAEKKYTAKIKSRKWGFTWMLSLYDYIYKKNSLSKREELCAIHWCIAQNSNFFAHIIWWRNRYNCSDFLSLDSVMDT